MKIFPAIDIKNGKCVRLIQGQANKSTVYGDPVEMALKWESEGFKNLHVVDLDGAFNGAVSSSNIVADIVKNIKIPVQIGGGIRTLDQIEYYIEKIGVSRVILGSVLLKDKEIALKAAKRFPGKIAAGIDAVDGIVSIKGWTEITDVKAVDLILSLKDNGIDTFIYTDIKRDGMLSGPNIKMTKELIDETGTNIIASGGVSDIDDIKKLKDIGASGVITGKALYSGSLKAEQLIDLQEE